MLPSNLAIKLCQLGYSPTEPKPLLFNTPVIPDSKIPLVLLKLESYKNRIIYSSKELLYAHTFSMHIKL